MKKKKILLVFVLAIIIGLPNVEAKNIPLYSVDQDTGDKYSDYYPIKFTGISNKGIKITGDTSKSYNVWRKIDKKNGKCNHIITSLDEADKCRLISLRSLWKDGKNRVLINLRGQINSIGNAKYTIPVSGEYNGKKITATLTISGMSIGTYYKKSGESVAFGHQEDENNSEEYHAYSSPSILIYIGNNGSLDFFTAGLKSVKFQLNNFKENGEKVVVNAYSTFDDIDGSQSFTISNISALVSPSGDTKCGIKNVGRNNVTGDCKTQSFKKGTQSYEIEKGENTATVTACNACLLKNRKVTSVSFYYTDKVIAKFTAGKNADNYSYEDYDYEEAGFAFGPTTIKKMTCDPDVKCKNGSRKKSAATTNVIGLSAAERQKTCCETTTEEYCSSFSCEAHDKIQNQNVLTTKVTGKSETEKIKTCCSDSNTCMLNESYFRTDKMIKKCCEYFKKDNYKNLVGYTKEQFETMFPVCFEGKIDTTPSDSNCTVSRGSSTFTSTATDTYLVKNYDAHVKMETVCKEQDCGERNTDVDSNGYATASGNDASYGSSSECRVGCYDSYELSLPGKYNDTIQIGQHFVWPDPKNDNYKLIVTSKKTCKILTYNVTNTKEMEACKKYYKSNNRLENATSTSQNIDVLLSYTSNPESEYKLSDTKLKVVSQNTTPTSGDDTYTKTQVTSYGLPDNLFAFVSVNGIYSISSSIETFGAAKRIGYGNLPVSWKLDSGSNLYTSLKIKGKINGRDVDFSDYTCKLTVDYPGGNKEKCPQYTPKAGQDPNGEYSKCLKTTDKDECVKKYCNNPSEPYCDKDCVNGECSWSEETGCLRGCIVSSGKDNCEIACCGRTSEPKIVVYRTIALSNPFPGKNGTGRQKGTNWSNGNDEYTYITSTSKYDSNPMFEITLGPSEIKSIRSLNQKTDYFEKTIQCNLDGNECRSNFLTSLIRNYPNMFKSNTCGMDSTDFDKCKSR